MRKFLFKPMLNRFDIYFISPICIVLGLITFKSTGLMALCFFLFSIFVIVLLGAVSAHEEKKVEFDYSHPS